MPKSYPQKSVYNYVDNAWKKCEQLVCKFWISNPLTHKHRTPKIGPNEQLPINTQLIQNFPTLQSTTKELIKKLSESKKCSYPHYPQPLLLLLLLNIYIIMRPNKGVTQ